jgi:predicted transcriptional regulator
VPSDLWEKEKLSTYVDSEVKDELEALAKRNQRSVAGELRVALERHLERERALREVAGEAY